MATNIKLETGGSVWKLLVDEGEEVKAGQEDQLAMVID